ncbi:hypothetical protein B0T16DRAFT_110211 [Cercophora newfieldiana]|uniref:Uncharacterized protein n=1 Tax=Cercophora newfieldiana TaxID=92897 RepID=A0AA39YI30_9PEZI|nr:hypothetical protein B0T16DRAFT_110211 [Cercophora newfieldiana]
MAPSLQQEPDQSCQWAMQSLVDRSGRCSKLPSLPHSRVTSFCWPQKLILRLDSTAAPSRLPVRWRAQFHSRIAPYLIRTELHNTKSAAKIPPGRLESTASLHHHHLNQEPCMLSLGCRPRSLPTLTTLPSDALTQANRSCSDPLNTTLNSGQVRVAVQHSTSPWNAMIQRFQQSRTTSLPSPIKHLHRCGTSWRARSQEWPPTDNRAMCFDAMCFDRSTHWGLLGQRDPLSELGRRFYEGFATKIALGSLRHIGAYHLRIGSFPHR